MVEKEFDYDFGDFLSPGNYKVSSSTPYATPGEVNKIQVGLEKKIDKSKSVKQYPTFDDLPKKGEEEILYLTLNDNKMYRWDFLENKYVDIAGSSDPSIKAKDVEIDF